MYFVNRVFDTRVTPTLHWERSMSYVKAKKEIQRNIFELTLAVYRVTDFFPQGEVLRRQIREKTNEIFTRVTEYGNSEDVDRKSVV